MHIVAAYSPSKYLGASDGYSSNRFNSGIEYIQNRNGKNTNAADITDTIKRYKLNGKHIWNKNNNDENEIT